MEGNLIQKVLFSREEVKEILDSCGEFKKVSTNNNQSYQNLYRRPSSSLIYIAKENQLIRDILLSKLNFFNIKSISYAINVLYYPTGTVFNRHSDGLYRYKTLVVQLSESTDYEGGELIVENSTASKDIGNVIIFDSSKLHEVKKVTSGERYSMSIWISPEDISTKKTII